MSSIIRRGSLRVQIILWSFVPTAIILVAVALVTFQAYQRVTEDLTVQRDREVARLNASQLDLELREYSNTLVTVARTLAHGTYQQGLHTFKQRLVIFDAGTIVLDNYGTVVAALPKRPKLLGQDRSDRSYFRRMLRSPDRPIFSNIVSDGADGTDVVVAAVPIINENGEFLGMVAGMFDLSATSVSAFYGSLIKFHGSDRDRTYLVDNTGRAIFHTDRTRIGQDLSHLPSVHEALAGNAGAIRTDDLHGEEIVAGFAPVPNTPWIIITEQRWSTLIGASQGYRQSLLVLLALGVIIPALVVTIGVRRITQPIAELIGASQGVAAGNFGQTLQARSRDEVGELTEQFNIMSVRLQESYANLERKVADRTRELATLNAIAFNVSRSLELDEILQNALNKTLQVMQLDVGMVYLLEEDNDTLVAMAHQGFSDRFVRRTARISIGSCVAANAAQEGHPVTCRTSDYPDAKVRENLEREDLQLVISVPLISKGKMLGAINLSTRTPRSLKEEELSLLAAIGQQVGIAVENARLYQAEKMRLDEVERRRIVAEGLRDILTILNSNHTFDQILDSLAAQASRLLGAEAVSIYRMPADGGPLYIQAARGLDEQCVANLQVPVGRGTVGVAAATRAPVPVPDVTAAIRNQTIDIFEDAGQWQYVSRITERFKAVLSVPLVIKDDVYGAISLYYPTPREFSEEDIGLAVTFADQTALAIENARLYEAEQARRRQADTLLQIASIVGSTLNLDEVLVRILNQLHRVVDYDSASIQLLQNDSAYVIAARGYADLPAVLELQFPLTEALPHGRVVRTGRPLNVMAVEKEFPALARPPYIEIQSWLGAPLRVQETIIGLITLEREERGGYSAEEIRLATAFADQAALAIENARLYQQAEQLAVMEERGRLARELHDSVTQSLYSLTLLAEAGRRLVRSGDLERVASYLSRLGETAQQALKEMRLLVYELRPLALEQEGLVGALQQRLDAVEKRAGMEARLLVEDEISLPVPTEEALYRIAQESLNNALKHAGATSVTVRLARENGRMVLEVSDDGEGFDPESAGSRGGMGLVSMQERMEKLGGELIIDSAADTGTTVRVLLKLSDSSYPGTMTVPFQNS